MLPAVLFDFCPKPPAPNAAAGSVTPGPIGMVAPAAGPKLMQPQQADLASSGPAIAAACRRLQDECLGPGTNAASVLIRFRVFAACD